MNAADANTGTIKLASLREIAAARLVRHITLIGQPDGTFVMEIDTGTSRVQLETARRREVRQFRTIDGALAIVQMIGLPGSRLRLRIARNKPLRLPMMEVAMTQTPNIAVARYPGQHAKDEEVVTHARCGQLDNLPLILRDVIISAVLLLIGSPLVGLLASLPPLAPYAWLAPAATATVVSLPLVHAVYCILWTATYRCTITNQRMIMRYGVFNPVSDESELFRFRDYKVIQPWYCRPFKRGTVMFWTTDQANAQFALLATKRPVEKRNTVRRLAQEARQAEGVHVVE